MPANRALDDGQHWTVVRLIYWHLDRGRWREAETLARGLLALDNGDGLAWKYYGEARRHQGEYDEAARAFRQALRRRSDDAELWMRLGRCLLRMGAAEEAKAALRRAQDGSSGLRRRIDALLKMCE